jgi:hypothetical protein
MLGNLLQNIRQLEEALHREWQQLSQQDIWRLTGVMRCRVDAVIQAREVTPGTEFGTIYVVLLELWRSILKMDMFYCNNWPCDIVIKYSLT